MRPTPAPFLSTVLYGGLLAIAAIIAPAAESPVAAPNFFLTASDVQRLRDQAREPSLAAAYANLREETARLVKGWLKAYPAQNRSAAELITIGRRDSPFRDYKTIATAFALEPTPELGRILREKLLASIGTRRIKNYWRPSGIHEGETAMQFLEAYDLAVRSGDWSDADRAEVREELRRCAQFLTGWTLDNGFSQGYTDYYRSVYCLNFHVFAAVMAGCIALYYPELPESPEWLRQAQTNLPRLLFTEFAEDGGYGEGSLHYWHPTFRALLQFMVASRTVGNRDYLADPAITEAMRRTLRWRMELTSPDGRTVAVGDSDRESLGAEYLMQGGRLFDLPGAVWVGQAITARARDQRIPLEPYDMFFQDLTPSAPAPRTTSANLPWSGYTLFRSSWQPDAEYVYLRHGTTYVGRREQENGLVISGHSHADALHVELHHRGIPLTVDPGRVGRYQDYDTYGGYCKATIAHNTVGLGNPWGYDRLDGRFAEHVQQHGAEFLYEMPQANIGRGDRIQTAFGATGALGIVSARLQTYPTVTHQRTIAWFARSGVTVLHDQLTSPTAQPYEWYLNPIGTLRQRTATSLTFGDAAGELTLIPLAPQQPQIQVLTKGDPAIPMYYVSLRPDAERRGTRPGKPYVVGERWGTYSLVVLKAQATATSFLNVLVPTVPGESWTSATLGATGTRLTQGDQEILVAAGGNAAPELTVSGAFGVLQQTAGTPTSYALHGGTILTAGGQTLLQTTLETPAWANYLTAEITAAVSLVDHRASFSLADHPANRTLIRFDPKKVPDEEAPLPVQIAVQFATGSKPRRIVALRSDTTMPDLDDPAFTQATAGWPNDPHQGHYLREDLPFTYDSATHLTTIHLDTGMRQIIWE